MGTRPLLIDVIKRVISYINNVKERHDSLANSAYLFETRNDVGPNFSKYLNKFNLSGGSNIFGENKNKIKKICQENYDKYWCLGITESPKAISYKKFKTTVYLEKYLSYVINIKHKIALTRFRLSNHNLLIEKGRHFRPKIERNERKCFLCKDDVEDESHFITKCPLYSNERVLLYDSLKYNSRFFEQLNDEQKFIFIMTNENKKVMVELARFVFNAMKVRERAIQDVDKKFLIPN